MDIGRPPHPSPDRKATGAPAGHLPGKPGDPGRESLEREAACRRGELRARQRIEGADHSADEEARIARSAIPHRSFAILADTVRDYAIFLMDPDGIITFWGEGARRVKRWTREQAEGAHLRLLYPDGGSEDGTAEAHLRQAAETGEYIGEGHRIRADGSTFWGQISLTALRDDDGTLLGFAKVTRDITREHETELALRRSEATLRALTDASPDIIEMLDAEGRFRWVSPAMREVLGHAPEALIDVPMQDLLHPEDREGFRVALREVIDGDREEIDFRYRALTRTGEWRILDGRGRVLRSAEPRHLVLLVRDVTEQVEVREQLERERELLAAMLENLAEGVAACDAEGGLTHFNRATREFHGLPLEPITQEAAAEHYDLYRADGRTRMRPEEIPLARALRGEVVRDVEMVIAPKGRPARTVLASSQALYNSRGEKLGAVVAMHDITERKRAEDALRESEELFRQLAENIHDAFWLYSADRSEIIYMSPAYAEIWGRRLEEVYGNPQDCLEAVHEDDRERVRNILADPRVHHEGVDLEYRIRRPDGEIRWIYDRGFPVRDASGRVYRMAGIAEDITERKRTEAQIEAQLAEKTVLLSEVHHRVKNNLQIISSLLNMQIRALADPAAIDALRESQSRTRAIALVHETLYRSGNFARIDLSDYLRRLASHIQRSSGMKRDVELRLELEPCTVPLDRAVPCGLILNELITNALKHAFPEGGPGEVRVTLRRDADRQYALTVSDNGRGFPRDIDLANVRSVGLQLVQDLSEQLDAELEVRGSPGTTFTIRLPDTDKST